MNLAILKYGCSRTENEIRCTLDITVFKILFTPGTTAKKNILKSFKYAMGENQAISLGKYSHSLTRSKSGIVFKSNVLSPEIIRIDKEAG